MDRESVITHLTIIHTWAEFARERDLNFFTAKHLEDIAQWADDALNLMKEQEGTINELQNAYGYLQKQFFEAQDKLLKEQDAVVPLTIDDAVSELMDKHYKRLKEQEETELCDRCGRVRLKSK